MAAAKVFGIGFHKTGTTSLSEALTILGYSVTGPNGAEDPDISQNVLEMATRLVEEYDAFQDNPWPILFRKLDSQYPGSKFILTLRPPDAWIRSLIRHFGDTTTPMRDWIYAGAGSPKGNERIYLERYESHNAEVLHHFKNRPDDLLVMKITDGDGWEVLCPFLGADIPSVPFPHQNRANLREREEGGPIPGNRFRRIRNLFSNHR